MKTTYTSKGYRGAKDTKISVSNECGPSSRSCNACAKYPLAKNDQLILTYGWGSSTTGISLCRACATEMKDKFVAALLES